MKKGFLLPKTKESTENTDCFICKHCKIQFPRLNTHLSQKSECKAVYTDEEIQTITTLLTSARKKRYNDQNREQINQNQSQYNKDHREQIRQNQKQYDRDHREEKNKKQAQRDKVNREKKEENWTEWDRFNAFQESIKWGWSFGCSSCHRFNHRDQVIDLKPQMQQPLMDMMHIDSLKQLCRHSQLWKHEGECKHICRTCYPYLRKYIKERGYDCCPRRKIWWVDGEEDPEKAGPKSLKEMLTLVPLEFLQEAWWKGWTEQILNLRAKMKTLIEPEDSDKPLETEDHVCSCSDEYMCSKCLITHVLKCSSTEHESPNCKTLLEKSIAIEHYKENIAFIDLLKSIDMENL